QGKPADFTGAVGQFDFDVIASKTDLKANESLSAQLKVTGTGNLKLFELPKLILPSSLEVYEPELDEQLTTNLSGTRGTVINNYTVVPQYRVKYPIPSVSFSYFDPKAKQYKTLRSQELMINVFEGPTNDTDAVANTQDTTVKQSISADDQQFRFI